MASPIGDAVFQSGVSAVMKRRLSEMNAPFVAADAPFGGTNAPFSSALQNSADAMAQRGAEVLASTVQELYGYTFIFGIAVLASIIAYHLSKNLSNPVPTLKSLYAEYRFEKQD